MSSGKLEQNYYENIENGLIYNEPVIFSEKYLHKSHFSESKSNEECFDLRFQDSYKVIVDEHFDMVQKIHFILKNTQDLTQKQKFDYCCTQRFFMKQYLKRIGDRI